MKLNNGTVNRVTIIGYVGENPELIYVNPSGYPVCNFSVATNENFKTQDGSYREETTWHRLTAWQNLAEYVSKNLEKGAKVYVEGRLENSQSVSKNGTRKDYITILVTEIKVL